MWQMFCSTFSSMYQYHAAYDLSSRFLKVVHRVRKKGDTGLLLLLFILLISFTGQTQQKMSGKTIIKYRITTLWNLCAQKSPCLAELSEVNSHARLNHSKQSLKNIHPLMLASFCSLTKTYLQWPHWKKNRQNYRLYVYLSTKKSSDILTIWHLCWRLGRVANPRPFATIKLRPVASECVCDWLGDATGLDCGDRSWISNAPLRRTGSCNDAIYLGDFKNHWTELNWKTSRQNACGNN